MGIFKSFAAAFNEFMALPADNRPAGKPNRAVGKPSRKAKADKSKACTVNATESQQGKCKYKKKRETLAADPGFYYDNDHHSTRGADTGFCYDDDHYVTRGFDGLIGPASIDPVERARWGYSIDLADWPGPNSHSSDDLGSSSSSSRFDSFDSFGGGGCGSGFDD